MTRLFPISLICTFALAVLVAATVKAEDPLPSWNEGPTKTAIVEFVTAVTHKISKDYVKPADHIATFDNDGTLWVDYPMYTQVLFAFQRVKELAPQRPEWKTKQPFKALLEGDMETVGKSGMKGISEIVMATHSGMTATEFAEEAGNWLRNTEHAKFKRPYIECIYQPQTALSPNVNLQRLDISERG